MMVDNYSIRTDDVISTDDEAAINNETESNVSNSIIYSTCFLKYQLSNDLV